MLSFACVLVFAFLVGALAENCEKTDGVRQSPININTSTAIIEKVSPLKWSSNYSETLKSLLVKNTGHNLMLFTNSESFLRLSSGLLPVAYKFLQLHFHWGEDDSKGSEHQINNYVYPMEMHVVHAQEETDKVDKYVVVAYFFRVSMNNNKGLDSVLDVALKAANHRNVSFPIKPIALTKILPTSPFSYYTYKGSLTTPPYTESVTWIVVDTAIPISESQLNVLRDAAKIDHELKNNYRCLQDLNDRKIRYVTI